MAKLKYLQIEDVADMNELFLEFCKIVDLNPMIVKRAFLKVTGTDNEVRKYVPSMDEFFAMISTNGHRWQMKATMRLEYVQDSFSEEEHAALIKEFEKSLPEAPKPSKTHDILEKQREEINPDLLPEKPSFTEVPVTPPLEKKMELPDFL